MVSATAFRAVATDLDGTLLRSDLTVSRRTRAGLAAARAHGVRHVVVTGRQAATCRNLLAAFGYCGLAVCGQGGQIYDVGGDRLVWSAVLDTALARMALAHVQAAFDGLSVGVATAGCDGRILVTSGFYTRPGADCLVVEPNLLWAQPIERVFFRHRAVEAAVVVEELARAFDDSVSLTYGQDDVVELLPPGVSKGQGLAFVADVLGFAAGETIAFGDMPNDIPMFEWAGYRVAMGNADERLRALADEVGPANDEDGVAVVLERVCATGGARAAAPERALA